MAASSTPAFLSVATIARFKIVTINASDLVCNPYAVDGTVMTTKVNVARPYLLQNALTSWNGLTFTFSDNQTRSATDGTNTETQVIVPAYVAGDQIYAINLPRGGTGVSGDNWIDLNLDGRAWAKQQDALTAYQAQVAS